MMKKQPPLFVLPIVLAAILGACGTAAIPAPVETVEVEAEVSAEPVESEAARPDAHRIKPGETLIEIATDYGLDYRELALWNGIADLDSIYVGDFLRLSPLPVVPAASPVVISKAPVVVSAPSAPKSNTAAPTFVPGGAKKNNTPNTAPNLPNLPVKEGPLAVKHTYAPETLAKVQRDEKAQTPRAPKPAAPATTVAKPSAAPSADDDKPAILLAQRRRFGVDWSWPSAGAVIEKFSESNKGINIAGKLGAPVYAGASGKVVYVGTGVKSYGRLVIIKHANDYLSAYAHNQTILVGEGEQVDRGQKIATLGESGAPMPMLHFEIRKAGKPFDPLRVLPKL